MRIRLTVQAKTDLDDIFDAILRQNPTAAVRVSQALREKIGQLADFPSLGRAGRVEGTRELVIAGTPYIAAYQVDTRIDAVIILAVLHAARQWPEDFQD